MACSQLNGCDPKIVEMLPSYWYPYYPINHQSPWGIRQTVNESKQENTTSGRMVKQRLNKSIGWVQRIRRCIDMQPCCRWRSLHVLSLPVIWLGIFPASLFPSQALLLFTPPFMFPSLAWSNTHWFCFYDLFLWSLSLSLSLYLCTNLLKRCRERIADWLWVILTPASVLWLAQALH